MTESPRVIDLARVRNVRARLDQIAARFPELVTADRGPDLAADWLVTLQRDLDDMSEPKTYSIAEVAALAGVHAETIRRAIRAGELAALQLHRNYRVSRVELARWWAARGGGVLFEEDARPAEEEPSR